MPRRAPERESFAWLDAHCSALLRRSASPTSRVLAATTRVLHAADAPPSVTLHVLRRWLLTRTRTAPDLHRLASHTPTWTYLTRSARRHPSPSPSSSLPRRRFAELLLAALLRPVPASAGRRSALILPAVAAAGVDLLTDERGWDTALIGAPQHGTDLGVTPGVARTALRRAEEERRLRTVSKRQGTASRYRLPGRLSGVDELVLHGLGSSVDALAGDWSVGDLTGPLEDPDEAGWPDDPLAALIVSVRHPAWGYGTWVDPRLNRPVDAWRLWTVALGKAAGFEDPSVLGVGTRPLPGLRRVVDRFGLGRIDGPRLRAQLDHVAASSTPPAWSLAADARADLRHRQAQRAAEVQRHRATRHVAALVEHLGDWPEGRDEQIVWAERAVAYASRRTVRPDSDRPVLVEVMTRWLVRSGADPSLAGRLADRIWAAPVEDSAEAA